MDKTLISGCKNSSDLLIKLMTHYGVVGLPYELAVQAVVARLAMEKYEVDSYNELYKILVQEVLPDSGRFYLMDQFGSLSSDDFLRSAGMALVDYASFVYDEKSLSKVCDRLHKEFKTPSRLNVTYSENKNNSLIRAKADEMLRLLKERNVDLEIMVNSYLNRKC